MSTSILQIRIVLLSLASALIIPLAATQAQPSPDGCANINPFVERRCVGERVAKKENRLGDLSQKALAAVAKGFEQYGEFDNRTDPAFFKRSQAEWKRFINDDCTVKAAFGGGSNSSISDRYMDCYEAELDRRIEFLEQLANESYGAG